jgi:hypothetical protein
MRTATMTQTGSRLRHRLVSGGVALGLALTLAGCEDVFDVTRPLGSHLDEGNFGNPTMTNIMLHNGELTYAEVLGDRFAEQVETTITFAFNSAVLDEQARRSCANRPPSSGTSRKCASRCTATPTSSAARPTTRASACVGPVPP